MTIETDIIQPVKDFIRDSKFLVNKCTKPDKKGGACFLRVTDRIHSDRYCHRDWFCRYGSGRLFREVDSHPHQQHSHWCLIRL